jgi:hypothetical protein
MENKNINELWERYDKMQEIAGELSIGADFRENVGDIFGDALKEGRGDVSLKELLIEIEEWFSGWCRP